MNDQWTKSDGTRWNPADRVRVARLFRAHVDTPSNRARRRSCRIVRQPCHWHPDEPGEAHHIDYEKPFVVVWVGLRCGCHRKVDHGAVKIPKRAIWDYTSLIEGPYGVAKMGLRVDESRSTACVCGKRPRWMVRAEKHHPECPKNCIEPVATGTDDAPAF